MAIGYWLNEAGKKKDERSKGQYILVLFNNHYHAQEQSKKKQESLTGRDI